MDSVRGRIADFIGLAPSPGRPAAEVIDRQPADGYARSVLRYGAPDHDQIEAFLFEPLDQVSLGGVLALHQHNSQWGIGKSEIAGLVGDSMQAFGPVLARRGVAVLAPDAIGFESRVGAPAGGASLGPTLTKSGSSADGWLQYYNQMAHRLVRGDLLIRKMLQDCQAAISVLQGVCPDGAPVGVLGHSMGGGVALFLGALDTRVEFTCSSGAVGSYRHKLARGIGLEMALVIPGFARHFDIDDVMRCIAPRRLLVVSGDRDLGSEDAADLVQHVRPIFDVVVGDGRLSHFRVPGGHALDQERFDFIVDWVSRNSTWLPELCC